MATVVIDNRIRLDPAEIGESAWAELRRAFTHKNPEHGAKLAMGIPVYGTPKEITTYSETKCEVSIPRGGIHRLVEILKVHRIPIEWQDERISGEQDPVGNKHRVELWPFQREMVDAALEAENCLLRAPTGSGKTSVAFSIAAECGVPTLVLVPTRALLDQWMVRAQKELGLKASEIGAVGGGKKRVRPLTIAIQASLANEDTREALRDKFGAIIYDEVQLAPAKTCFQAVDFFPAKYRIGVSADHRRKDRKEFLSVDLFGEVVADIKRPDLVKAGYVLDVEILAHPTDFDAPWYGAQDDEETTTDNFDFDRLVRQMADDDARNAIVVDAALEEVEAGEQVFVMAWRVEHCRLLDQLFARRGVRSGLMVGADRQEFVRSRQDFERGALRVAVGTFQAIGQGIDMPSAATVVVAGPIASNRQFFGQVRGRVCRIAPGKTHARMHYVWDQRLSNAERHLRNLVAWNKSAKVLDATGKWADAKAWLRARRAA